MNTSIAERDLRGSLPTLRLSYSALASSDSLDDIFLTPELNRDGPFAVGVLSDSAVAAVLDPTRPLPINAGGKSPAKYNGSPAGLSFLGQ